MTAPKFSIINPIAFLPAMLINTPAAEVVPLWLVGAPYAAGQKARLDTTHRIYQCLIPNSGASPDVNISGNTPSWQDIGATNNFCMFDDKWGSQTTSTGSLIVALAPGVAIDSLALLNMLGSQVVITCTVAGVTKYTKTIKLRTSIGVYDWKTYFMAPIVAETDIVLTDLLPYAMQQITIELTGPGEVAIGNVAMGSHIEFGALEYNATLGIISYSKKDVDVFGNIVIVKRPYAKRFGGRLVIENSFVDQLAAILASIRDTPVVWIGVGSLYSSLIVWGFFKDFEIDIAYPTTSYCTLTIEGLV